MNRPHRPAGERPRARLAAVPAPAGPGPWQQTQWDWRAAGNIGCGGAGAGLIVVGVSCGAQGPAPRLLLLGGLALIGLGLACVWAEIGRPLRALHVFLHPHSSWMSREAFFAALLMPVTLLAALGRPALAWPAAALALAFVVSQARMLHGARGIRAWREPWVVPLLVVTGLAEGAGLLVVVQASLATDRPGPVALAGLLVLARAALWAGYRRRVGAQLPARAATALDAAGRWLVWGGTLAPLLALVAGAALGGPAATLALRVAGLLVAATGLWFKFVLVTRAGFNQGYALAHLPVRGVPR